MYCHIMQSLRGQGGVLRDHFYTASSRQFNDNENKEDKKKYLDEEDLANADLKGQFETGQTALDEEGSEMETLSTLFAQTYKPRQIVQGEKSSSTLGYQGKPEASGTTLLGREFEGTRGQSTVGTAMPT